MPNLNQIVKVTKEQMNTLISGGDIKGHKLSDDVLYAVEDSGESASSSQGGGWVTREYKGLYDDYYLNEPIELFKKGEYGIALINITWTQGRMPLYIGPSLTKYITAKTGVSRSWITLSVTRGIDRVAFEIMDDGSSNSGTVRSESWNIGSGAVQLYLSDPDNGKDTVSGMPNGIEDKWDVRVATSTYTYPA